MEEQPVLVSATMKPEGVSGWVHGTKSWEDARTACQSEGGDLAVMETEELWKFREQSVYIQVIVTVRKRSCGKVMFLHLSDILLTLGEVYNPLGRHIPL